MYQNRRQTQKQEQGRAQRDARNELTAEPAMDSDEADCADDKGRHQRGADVRQREPDTDGLCRRRPQTETTTDGIHGGNTTVEWQPPNVGPMGTTCDGRGGCSRKANSAATSRSRSKIALRSCEK